MNNEIWLIIVIIESVILITMFFIIGFYKNWVIEEIEKRVKEKHDNDKIIEELNTKIENDKNTLDEHTKKFLKLQEIEIRASSEVDRLIKLIDEATPKVSDDNVSAKYKLDFENKLTRIVEPQNTFKLINDTDSDLMVSVTKIVSDTIITDSKPYFIKLRKTNHIDIEHVSSMDTCF